LVFLDGLRNTHEERDPGTLLCCRHNSRRRDVIKALPWQGVLLCAIVGRTTIRISLIWIGRPMRGGEIVHNRILHRSREDSLSTGKMQ